jgi:hypothetical protein
MLVAEDVVASVAAGSSPSGAEAPSSSAATRTYFARATFHSLISKEFEFKLP